LKLPASQLKSHLQRNLSGMYLVAADEPLLVAEAGDAIRAAAREQGFEERSLHFIERGFKWEALKQDADSLSLFASRRVVEIRMTAPRPGDAGARAIRALAEDKDPDRLVIITIQARLDANAARSVWVKTVEKAGVVVDIRPVTRATLPGFIQERARRYRLKLDHDAADFLSERVEGNLLAADQELIKLSLIREDGHVDASAVVEAVSTSARYDVFRLGDAIIAGDLNRAITVLDGLKSEGMQPPLVLWSLVREITLLAQLKAASARGADTASLMGRLRVWQSRQASVRRALDRYTFEDLTRLLERAARVDRIAKGLEHAPVWEAIRELLLEAIAPEHRLSA
jgi:DNA polymerase-3 subunit delta